jgi:hypothetical protein
MNLFTVIYVGTVKPLRGNKANNLELFSEYVTCSICILQVIFTDYVKDPYNQYQFGWVFIGIISTTIIIFLYISLEKFLYYLKLYIVIGCKKLKRYIDKLKKPDQDIKTAEKRQSLNVLMVGKIEMI